MALYTPFMAQAGATMGNAIAQRGQNKMASDAYLEKPGAMEELMKFNPALGMKIQQYKQQQAQMQLAEQASKQEKLQALHQEKREFFDESLKEAAKFDNYEEASNYLDQRKELIRPEVGDIVDSFQFTPEMFQQVKQVHGEGAGQSFGGTSEFAQVSNMLVKGVEDPLFRNTPEYARAWQLANEPKIVRTPTGDILQKPQIDSQFKPPGPDAIKEPIPAEQVQPNPATGEPKESVIIPGTEKISVDQKAYNKDYSLLKKSYDSMQNYVDVLTKLGPQMSVGPLNTSDAQELESAYARAMLDAKETNNLGVLNGPDVGIIRKLMGDPTGVSGQIKGKEALIKGATEAMKQITDNFNSLNGMMEDTPVKTRDLAEGEKPRLNETDLSVTIKGQKHIFPSIEQFNAYKEAAGL